jgi:hypothetical protein
VTLSASTTIKWKIEASAPIVVVMIGPVPIPVNVIVGGEGGFRGSLSYNSCDGKRTINGCGYIRFSIGVEGCGEVPYTGTKACLKGQGFGRKQWCTDGKSYPLCIGGRISAKFCALWRCREYILVEWNNCTASGGGDEGGG